VSFPATEALNIIYYRLKDHKNTTISISSLSNSRLSMRALSRIDRRVLVILVLVVFGSIALIGFVIYITNCLKKRRPNEAFGPYEGTLVHPADLAAQITPFGGSGPHRGRNMPRFMRTPGEDMRVAFRRPDGSWHIADSRAPFKPAGVNDIDVLPSHSASTSECSFSLASKEWEVKKVGCEVGYGFSTISLPPPAYTRRSESS